MLWLYTARLQPEELRPDLGQEAIRAHTEFTHKLKEAGGFVSSAPLEPVERARTVRLRRRERLVIDGPFAETKETLGGYYLSEADSLDAAVAWAHEIGAAHQRANEVRPALPTPVPSPAFRFTHH